MQEKRLELSWYCYHTDLNRARLPIPPLLRTKLIIHTVRVKVNLFLKKISKKMPVFQFRTGQPASIMLYPLILPGANQNASA